MTGSLSLRETRPTDRPFLLAVYGSTRADELALVDWDAPTRAAFLQMQFDAQDRHYRTIDRGFVVGGHLGYGLMYTACGRRSILSHCVQSSIMSPLALTTTMQCSQR